MTKRINTLIEGEDAAMHKDIEDQVIGQLDRSAKLDEVDTITFGLETDDGKIVKVYVNSEQADDFEKALADKLGEVDDIEECLNELSKEFEIVDVEWPDEKSDDSDEDEESEGQPETDGSEVMNKKVYDNTKEKSSKDNIVRPKMEGHKVKFKSQVNLMEDSTTIESRMTTPAQLMIYHAIVELGIPEIALNKSPYKSTIIQSIKHRALDINKAPSLKAALKAFVARAHNLDGKEHEEHKNTHDKKHVKESMIIESIIEDFWNCITKIIKYLSPDDKHAQQFIETSKFKTLVSRSSMVIPKVVNSDLRMKVSKLSDSLEANDASVAAMAKQKMTESVSPDVATTMFTNLFTLVDPTPTKSVSKTLLNSPEFKAYFTSIKPKLSQKFSGVMSQKFIDFCKSLQAAIDETQPKQEPNTTTTTPGNPTTPATTTTESIQRVLKEAIEWSFEKDGDNSIATTEGLKITLDPEQLEKAVKSINTKNVIIVKDAEDPKVKYTFSPRGINVAVKKLGENTSYMMNSDQVQDFMSMVVSDEPKSKGKEEE